MLVEVRAAIVGNCFDVFFGSLPVIAGVQLWERMSVHRLFISFVDEGAASDCRCFWLDLNHDGQVFC